MSVEVCRVSRVKVKSHLSPKFRDQMDKVVRAKDFMGQLVLGAVLEHPVLVLVVDLSREDNRLI
jgi:hypothetical protein